MLQKPQRGKKEKNVFHVRRPDPSLPEPFSPLNRGDFSPFFKIAPRAH
jgi:hypothetical protein